MADLCNAADATPSLPGRQRGVRGDAPQLGMAALGRERWSVHALLPAERLWVAALQATQDPSRDLFHVPEAVRPGAPGDERLLEGPDAPIVVVVRGVSWVLERAGAVAEGRLQRGAGRQGRIELVPVNAVRLEIRQRVQDIRSDAWEEALLVPAKRNRLPVPEGPEGSVHPAGPASQTLIREAEERSEFRGGSERGRGLRLEQGVRGGIARRAVLPCGNHEVVFPVVHHQRALRRPAVRRPVPEEAALVHMPFEIFEAAPRLAA